MTVLIKAGRSSLLLVIAITVVLALVMAPAVSATGSSGANRCIVKFVCGEVTSADAEDSARAVDGIYRTSINVLNAGTRSVTYRKTLQTTTPCEPEEEEVATFENPVAPSATIAGTLIALRAFDIDCREIFDEFGACGPLAEGFLVLEASGPLSVTTVYTAGSGDPGGVSSIDVEEVTCGSGSSSSSGDDDDDD